MPKEFSYSVKSQLIGLLNKNIRLEEAALMGGIPAQGLQMNVPQTTFGISGGIQQNQIAQHPAVPTPGMGGSGVKVRSDSVNMNFNDILMGSNPKAFGAGVGTALTTAAAGSVIGGLGRKLGPLAGTAITQAAGNLPILGGFAKSLGQFGQAGIAGLGNNLETLSGAPTLTAQLGAIGETQVANRLADLPGWAPKIAAAAGSQLPEPETAAETSLKLRQQRVANAMLKRQEKKLGLSP